MTQLIKCGRCGTRKVPQDFYIDAHRASGLQTACKACSKKYSREYREAHPEEVRAAVHSWEANNKGRRKSSKAAYCACHSAEISAYGKAYSKVHRKEIKARKQCEAYLAKGRAQAKAWRKANPGRTAEQKAARKAAQLKATPVWADKAAIQEVYRQARLMTLLSGVKYHVDHTVPLKSKIVSGLHVEFNLQILPAVENTAKGNRTWPDMPEQLQEEKEMT